MIDKCGGFRVTLGHSVKYAEKQEQCFHPNSRRREVSIAIAGFIESSCSAHSHVIVSVCILYAWRSHVPMCVVRACASLRVCVTGNGQLQNIPNTEQPYHSLVASGIYRYNEYVVFHRSFPLPSRLLAMSVISSYACNAKSCHAMPAVFRI